MPRTLLLGAALLVVAPASAVACGACIGRVIDYGLPFLGLWWPLFLGWGAVGGVVEGRLRRWSLWFALGMLVGTFLAVGCLQVPLCAFLLWWLGQVVVRALGRGEHGARPAWWLVANRALAVVLPLTLAWAYGVSFSDPARLIGLAADHADPRWPTPAGRHLERLGRPALPAVVAGLIESSEPDQSRRERHVKNGLAIAGKMAGRTFADVVEFQAWWSVQPEAAVARAARERWLPAPPRP